MEISLGIAIGTVFSKILYSSRSSCLEMFDKKRVLINFIRKHLYWSLFIDKATSWRTGALLKETSEQVFYCVYFETPSDVNWLICCCCWLIFSRCCCCWCCHIKFLIKSSLTPLGRRKAVFTLLAASFQNVSLRFTWIWLVDNLFSLESAKKVENSQLFFSLIFFSTVFQMSRLCMHHSKIKRNFLPTRKF